MTLRALRLAVRPHPVGPARCELDVESIPTIKETRAEALPLAYVVRNDDLPRVCEMRGWVVDRGWKHKAKGLSALLFGQRKIPAIRGSYAACGQLARSVRTMLRNAVEKDERNIYVIGADNRIFEELWRRSESPVSPEDTVPWHLAAQSSSPVPLLHVLALRYVPEELRQTYIGEADEIEEVRQLILRAAEHNDPVLILGETGTGKEIVARAIHRYGERRAQRFTAINCGAIPRDLLESELFGHKKGAFTDAHADKEGLWPTAHRGTLFLDEVGDLTFDHQVKVLRTLQEGSVRPVGSSEELTVDTRVIAATNRDLFSMVRTGQFREDLYYRIRAFVIRTPALRDHPTDIPILARAFWKRITGDEDSALPEEFLSELQSYHWPGNANELRAILATLHALFGKDDLGVEQLRTVFSYHGRVGVRPPLPPPEQEIIPHEVKCLRHLKRAIDVVRACEVALRPLVVGHKTDGATLESVQVAIGRLADELELLCARPLLFHRESQYAAVHELIGRLVYFESLLGTDVDEALNHLTDKLSGRFGLVVRTLSREAQRIFETL